MDTPASPAPTDAPGALHYWVAIDVAAAALDVNVANAYVIAKREGWRRTPTKPRGYLMADIHTTATKRKARTS